MKRDPALQDLSREHYDALKLARDGKAAALSGERSAVTALAARIVDEFETALEPHFREEEAVLLPFLTMAGESELVWRTLTEHAELRALARDLRQADSGSLLRFSKLLAEHVRFEERSLFEAAQAKGFPPADAVSGAAAAAPAAAARPAAPAPRP